MAPIEWTREILKDLLSGFWAKAAILFAAYIQPIQCVFIMIYSLSFLFLVFELVHKKRIQLKKISKELSKVFIYSFLVLLFSLIETLPNVHVPLTGIVSTFIILTQLQSTLKSLNRLVDNDILEFVIDRIEKLTKIHKEGEENIRRRRRNYDEYDVDNYK